MHTTPLPSSITLTVTFQESLPDFWDALADMSYHIAHQAITGWRVVDVMSDVRTVVFSLSIQHDTCLSAEQFRQELDIGFQRLSGDGEYPIAFTLSFGREASCADIAGLAV